MTRLQCLSYVRWSRHVLIDDVNFIQPLPDAPVGYQIMSKEVYRNRRYDEEVSILVNNCINRYIFILNRYMVYWSDLNTQRYTLESELRLVIKAAKHII